MIRGPSVAEGATGPECSFGPLTRTDIVRYAGASHDFNPIHHDEPHARASGYPGVFAHGMLSAGLLGSYLGRWLGPGRVRRLRVRFHEIVWPGDTLSAQGEITRVHDVDGERHAEVRLALVRNGDTVAKGSATVVVE